MKICVNKFKYAVHTSRIHKKNLEIHLLTKDKWSDRITITVSTPSRHRIEKLEEAENF